MRYHPSQNSTVLECLQALFPDCSKTTLKNFFKEGRVWVADKLVKIPATVVPAGTLVEVRREKFVSRDLPNVKILFEDGHFLVTDKRAQFLSVATDKEKSKTAFHEVLHYLQQKNARARLFVVHRLDYGTSGLLLFAKTEEAQKKIKDLFASRQIERCYRAVVEGCPKPEQGKLESRLAESQTLRVYVTQDRSRGKHAVSHYQVLQKGKIGCLVEVKLETGRRGQIRVQLADLGHPVVGDHEYGSSQDPIGRLCLHAHRLAFTHPFTEKHVAWESPTPGAFRNALGGFTR